MLLRFDGIQEDDRRFLVNLRHEISSDLSIQTWIETVWVRFTGKALEWINNNKEMEILLQKELFDETDKRRFIQLICEKYPIVRKPVIFRSEVVDRIHDIKQNKDEVIKEYYERVNDFFIVEIGCKDNTKEVTLNDVERMWISIIIDNWIKGFDNHKLRVKMRARYLSGEFKSLLGAYIAAERLIRIIQAQERFHEEKIIRRVQEIRKTSGIQVSIIFQIQQSNVSRATFKELLFNMSEICTAVNITNIESIASESRK